ncbi:MAG: serine/threonine protein kinase [Myxococcales bacterium]|nr:MAG: serine/threonine protein kinase [Myxococcales bacterium]
MERTDSAESFGPYEIIRRLAVGGMSEVLLARHFGLEGLERRVVIKRIREGLSRDEEFRTMFLDEARLMAALCHPNIAQVFELGQVGESYHLVMEYVRGPTLNTILHAASKHGLRGLSPSIALHIALGIAEAMAYVHSCKDDLGRPLRIVHRDLKPANIIVSYDGAVKLIDFGIAKAASKVYETRTGVIKGTYGYIAPEQLAHGSPVDHRVDVFALGIILYEMVVGEHPFDTSDDPDLLDRILNARYTRPRKLVPTIPRSLDKLITQCLAPHPEGRPEDMASLIEQLLNEQLALGRGSSMRNLSDFIKQLVPDMHGPAPLKPMTEYKSAFPEYSVAAPRPDGTAQTTAEGHVAIAPPHDNDEDEGTQRMSKDAVTNMAQNMASHEEVPDASESNWDELLTMVAPSSEGLPIEPTHGNATLPIYLSSTPPPGKRSSGWVFLALLLILLAALGAYVTVSVFPKPPVVLNALQNVGLKAWIDMLEFGSPKQSIQEHKPNPASKAGTLKERSIKISSDPSGATIVLNGKTLAEKTPAAIKVPANLDKVSVRVSKKGYAGYLQELGSESTSEHFILLPLQGSDGEE